MSHHECLNCGHVVENNFCPNCGQSAMTHRFSLKHIFSHDLLHGLLHIDKGFFFTAKELLTNPGRSIRKYIEGQRVRHYNYFAFVIVIVALYVFTVSAAGIKISDYVKTPTEEGRQIDQLLTYILEHYKILVLLAIPVSSGVTYLFFLKAKQNFAEHLVLNTYKAGGDLLINLLFVSLVPVFRSMPYVLLIYPFITVLYGIWFYRQYFAKDYKSKFVLNMLSTYAHMLSQALSILPLLPYLLQHTNFFIQK